jgi:hypothetical protein
MADKVGIAFTQGPLRPARHSTAFTNPFFTRALRPTLTGVKVKKALYSRSFTTEQNGVTYIVYIHTFDR